MDVSGQLQAPAALLPGKIPRNKLHWRLRWPQIWSGQGYEEKKSLPLPEIEPRVSSP